MLARSGEYPIPSSWVSFQEFSVRAKDGVRLAAPRHSERATFIHFIVCALSSEADVVSLAPPRAHCLFSVGAVLEVVSIGAIGRYSQQTLLLGRLLPPGPAGQAPLAP